MPARRSVQQRCTSDGQVPACILRMYRQNAALIKGVGGIRGEAHPGAGSLASAQDQEREAALSALRLATNAAEASAQRHTALRAAAVEQAAQRSVSTAVAAARTAEGEATQLRCQVRRSTASCRAPACGQPPRRPVAWTMMTGALASWPRKTCRSPAQRLCAACSLPAGRPKLSHCGAT